MSLKVSIDLLVSILNHAERFPVHFRSIFLGVDQQMVSKNVATSAKQVNISFSITGRHKRPQPCPICAESDDIPIKRPVTPWYTISSFTMLYF